MRRSTTDLLPHGFRRAVSAARIGEAGFVETIGASPKELAAIAAYLGLLSLEALTAELTLARWRGKGVKVTGAFKADVTQACVVTLEPLPAHVESAFERRFLPEESASFEDASHEVFVDPEGEDPPEALPREIDLGAIVVEELSLALEPYPRKSGVELQSSDAPTATRPSPFAALAKLKPKSQETE